MPIKDNSLTSKSIDIVGFYIWISVASQSVVRLIIGKKEDDVGLFFSCL
jgi:hypothetical protein